MKNASSAGALVCVAVLGILAACSRPEAPGGAPAGQSVGDGAKSQGVGAHPKGGQPSSVAPMSALSGRTEALVAASDDQITALFYSVAGLTPPIDEWVERDVAYSPSVDKTEERARAREKYAALMRSVEKVGTLQVDFNANLSDYDVQYQEFMIDGVSASSSLSFRGFEGRQSVQVRFRNGRAVNTWKVKPEEVQPIMDKLGGGRSLTLSATLQVVGATPVSGRYSQVGVIDVDIVSYDISSTAKGLKIGRIVAQ